MICTLCNGNDITLTACLYLSTCLVPTATTSAIKPAAAAIAAAATSSVISAAAAQPQFSAGARIPQSPEAQQQATQPPSAGVTVNLVYIS
jgi:hypothetical protein